MNYGLDEEEQTANMDAYYHDYDPLRDEEYHSAFCVNGTCTYEWFYTSEIESEEWRSEVESKLQQGKIAAAVIMGVNRGKPPVLDRMGRMNKLG